MAGGNLPDVPSYDRSDPDALRTVDEWSDGVGWLAHPDEDGRRVGHAVASPDGLWLFDPLDAPGLDDLLAARGEVAGVAVLSNWHARDAGAIASRHGVPVTVPAWDPMDRVVERVDAPVERATGPVAGFDLRRLDPLPGWTEAVAHRPADGTLYVPDVLSSAPGTPVGAERVGLSLVARPFPPRETLADLGPERLLFGHGTGVFEDAADALATALDGARWRFPRALATTGPTQIRALLGALRD